MSCKTLLLLSLLMTPLSAFSPSISNYDQNNFQQAKVVTAKINADAPADFYCGCKISWQGKKGVPDLSSCGYSVRKNANRAAPAHD